jgi:hypothetical protein
MKSMAGVLMATVSVLVSLSPAMAQNRCSNTPDYFAPVTSGDGQRYPLEIGRDRTAEHILRLRCSLQMFGTNRRRFSLLRW